MSADLSKRATLLSRIPWPIGAVALMVLITLLALVILAYAPNNSAAPTIRVRNATSETVVLEFVREHSDELQSVTILPGATDWVHPLCQVNPVRIAEDQIVRASDRYGGNLRELPADKITQRGPFELIVNENGIAIQPASVTGAKP